SPPPPQKTPSLSWGDGLRFFRKRPERRPLRQTDAALRAELERRVGRVQWDARQLAGADQRRPTGRALPCSLNEGIHPAVQLIDLVERVQLRQTTRGILLKPVNFRRLANG